MAGNTRYHGRGGRMYASQTGAAAASPVASLSMWSIDASRAHGDTTCFEDGNETSLLGFPAYKGTFSGFWDSADETIFKAGESSTGCNLYLYPAQANAITKYWYGPAWIDYKVDVNVKNPVPISGTWVANGAWGRF